MVPTAGKTTFFHALMGKIEPLQGELKFGASLKVGYFAQAHEGLNPDNTVLDELLRHKQMLFSPRATTWRQYLYHADDV